MSNSNDADDPSFHYEIWKGPSAEFDEKKRSISYVENHNAEYDYHEIALDFAYAADELIEQYKDSQLSNWIAPVAHLCRQVIELKLKALLTAIRYHDKSASEKELNSHNLGNIWKISIKWMISNNYDVRNDLRIEDTENLILSYDAIDPTGDLFRFGVSRKKAFGKNKSCDRVGIEINLFESQYISLKGFLSHWEAVLTREIINKEMAWENDPYFDSNDYPKRRN